jgi:hypothetical protein
MVPFAAGVAVPAAETRVDHIGLVRERWPRTANVAVLGTDDARDSLSPTLPLVQDAAGANTDVMICSESALAWDITSVTSPPNIFDMRAVFMRDTMTEPSDLW